MTYKFTIEGRLPNLNDYTEQNRRNRYAGAEFKANAQKVAEIAIKKQLRGIEVHAPVYMLYRWYEKDKRRDLDNISSFGRKVIQDALVSTGVLVDDGWDYIKSYTDEFYVDRTNPRIEVSILEVGR